MLISSKFFRLRTVSAIILVDTRSNTLDFCPIYECSGIRQETKKYTNPVLQSGSVISQIRYGKRGSTLNVITSRLFVFFIYRHRNSRTVFSMQSVHRFFCCIINDDVKTINSRFLYLLQKNCVFLPNIVCYYCKQRSPVLCPTTFE